VRELKDATRYKYDLLFRQLQAFAEETGLVFISDLDLEAARAFRASWPNKNLAASKKLEHFRAFLKFCRESDWIRSNPATKLKPGKVASGPTLPFDRVEGEKILKACEKYPDKENAVRLRALVLLLRYSVLRLGDGVTLERSRIEKDRLRLYKDEQARALAASPHSKSADPARNGRATYGNRAIALSDAVAVSFLYSALA
jgi:integrase/recombinase XerD